MISGETELIAVGLNVSFAIIFFVMFIFILLTNKLAKKMMHRIIIIFITKGSGHK